MSVRRAQQEIDSREFAEWCAYSELEPFGYDRLDVGPAIVASVIANVNRGKTGKRYKPADFLPKYSKQRKQDLSGMLAIMDQAKQRIAGRMGNNGN